MTRGSPQPPREQSSRRYRGSFGSSRGQGFPSREGSERREAGLVAQGAVRTTSSLCSGGGTGSGTEGQHSSFPDLAMSVGHRVFP